MGLYIERMGGDDIKWHYGALHFMRYAACRTCGYEGSHEDFTNAERDGVDGVRLWDLYPDFRQLLHFSDCEGIFVPDGYADGFEDSFHIGSFHRLTDEVNELYKRMKKNPDYNYDESMQYVTDLRDLIINEDEGQWILIFG